MRPADASLEALGDVAALAQRAGWGVVVIGAAVPWILATGEDERRSLRATVDADAAVGTGTWEEFEKLAAALAEELGFRRVGRGHRFHRGEAQVDLVPFGEGVVSDGKIVWPDGTAMSAFGLAEAFASAVWRDVGGREIRVASEAAFVIMKLIAYQESSERRKDVVDVVRLLARYQEESDRRYELVGGEVDGATLDFGEMGAYLMGRDVGALARPRSLEVIHAFVTRIEDEQSTPVMDVIREEGRRIYEERAAEVYRLLRVFAAALNDGRLGGAAPPTPGAVA